MLPKIKKQGEKSRFFSQKRTLKNKSNKTIGNGKNFQKSASFS